MTVDLEAFVDRIVAEIEAAEREVNIDRLRQWKEGNPGDAAAAAARWVKENPLARQDISRRYHRAHLEQEHERSRRYREENPGRTRRYREENPDRARENAREYARQWRAANREHNREWWHQYRAARKAAALATAVTS